MEVWAWSLLGENCMLFITFFWGKNEYLVLISKVKKSGKLYTLVACPKVHGVGEKELSPPLLVRVTQEEIPTPFLLVKHIWWGEESVVHLFVHH